MFKKTAIVLLCLTILAGTMCMTVSAAGNEGTAYLLDLDRSYSCFSRYADDNNYTFDSLSWTDYSSSFLLSGSLITGEDFPTTCTFVNLGIQDMTNGFIRVPSGQTVVVSACVGLMSADVTYFGDLFFGSRYSIGDAEPIHVTKKFTFSSADRYSLVYYSLTNNTGQDITIKSVYYYAGLKGGLSTCQLMFDMKYKIVDDAEKVQQYIEEQTETLIHGWDGSGTPMDGDNVSDFKDAEFALNQGQAAGVADTKSLFSSVMTQLSQFQPAFLGISAFMNDLFGIPLFALLLTCSMAFGVLALLLNLANGGRSSIERIKRDHENRKADKMDSYDERWLM